MYRDDYVFSDIEFSAGVFAVATLLYNRFPISGADFLAQAGVAFARTWEDVFETFVSSLPNHILHMLLPLGRNRFVISRVRLVLGKLFGNLGHDRLNRFHEFFIVPGDLLHDHLPLSIAPVHILDRDKSTANAL